MTISIAFPNQPPIGLYQNLQLLFRLNGPIYLVLSQHMCMFLKGTWVLSQRVKDILLGSHGSFMEQEKVCMEDDRFSFSRLPEKRETKKIFDGLVCLIQVVKDVFLKSLLSWLNCVGEFSDIILFDFVANFGDGAGVGGISWLLIVFLQPWCNLCTPCVIGLHSVFISTFVHLCHLSLPVKRKKNKNKPLVQLQLF